MTDPLRFDRPPAGADVPERDRDARIEQFLLVGLDHYFAEQYELAINVWTRVLFIDRGHARARAYIERARSAIAERQRQAEELLQTGSAAFDRGDAGAARALVASAVEHGAPPDEALALIERIDRLEKVGSAATPVRPAIPRQGNRRHRVAAPVRARWGWIAAGVLAGALLGMALFAVLLRQGGATWPVLGAGEAVPVSTLDAPLPVPSSAELALSRAETLYARGRLHDALAALERVPDGDARRPRADALATLIQRQLLAAATPTEPRRP